MDLVQRVHINGYEMEELFAAKDGRRQFLDHNLNLERLRTYFFRVDGSPVRCEAVKRKSRWRNVRDREPQLDEQQGREGRQGEE